jgi:uncharacterized membrane-anchored protein YhcB (DUF1043 family)
MITSIVPVSYIGPGTGRAVLMAWLPCIVGIAFWGFVVYGLIQLIRFLASARKEQKLIRMELSKLAEEVHQIRKESKDTLDQKGDG